jgi:hypothetical protein
MVQPNKCSPTPGWYEGKLSFYNGLSLHSL